MKCAPKIWKKFTKRQKLLWTACYNRFVEELNMQATGVSGTQEAFRNTAHNLACEAVWVEAKELELYE